VRRNAQKGFALAQIHADQSDVGSLQITQSAMDDPRRCRRGATTEIVSFEQDDTKAAERGVARHPATDDAAADDGDIKGLPLDRCRPMTLLADQRPLGVVIIWYT
jgi:hypothetical protein